MQYPASSGKALGKALDGKEGLGVRVGLHDAVGRKDTHGGVHGVAPRAFSPAEGFEIRLHVPGHAAAAGHKFEVGQALEEFRAKVVGGFAFGHLYQPSCGFFVDGEFLGEGRREFGRVLHDLFRSGGLSDGRFSFLYVMIMPRGGVSFSVICARVS